jgi:hypothetical protein
MKQRIIAIALAVAASPALALEAGPPFEQTQLDRVLPDVPAVQNLVNRGMPVRQAAADAYGTTRVDAGADMKMPESPWANDFNFIAPPQ